MSKSTISTFELFEMFPDQETARVYLENNLWPEGPNCPVCGLGERITERKNGFYRCNLCKEDFTVRTGTIFERSHIPLHKWLYAMYLLLTARKGISRLQLSKEIGIRQASAWFMLHRIREACGPRLKKLRGIIEIDECFVGGIEANKHENKKLKAGRGTVGKTAVLGCANAAVEGLQRRSRAQIRKQFKPLSISTSKSDRSCIPTKLAHMRALATLALATMLSTIVLASMFETM